MAKGKKARGGGGGGGGRKITLKMARNAVRVTPDGWRRLDLSNRGIAAMPPCLRKLADALDELDLSRNLLRKLPDWLGQFRGLRRLDLHSNRLEEIPAGLGQLRQLAHLNLCDNRLVATALPPEMADLVLLESLNLGMNLLACLPPALASLANLRHLGLFDNLLTEVPDFVRDLPGLHRLDTARNPLESAGGDGDRGGGGGEPLFLVREGCLCKPCLGRCRQERDRRRRKTTEGEEGRGNGRFAGLITPNSAALLTQGVWRCRPMQVNARTCGLAETLA